MKAKGKEKKSGACAVDEATLKKIEEAYAKLNGPEAAKCKSLLKKHFTKDVLESCKCRKTKLGASLYDVIRSGVYNLDAGVGVYAPDAESYKASTSLRFRRLVLYSMVLYSTARFNMVLIVYTVTDNAQYGTVQYDTVKEWYWLVLLSIYHTV